MRNKPHSVVVTALALLGTSVRKVVAADVVKVNVPASVQGPEATTIVGNITNMLLWVAGVASVIAIVVGGIMYITSSGDEKRVSSAKNTILYAVVGMIVALMAYAIASFVVTNIK